MFIYSKIDQAIDKPSKGIEDFIASPDPFNPEKGVSSRAFEFLGEKIKRIHENPTESVVYESDFKSIPL